MSRTAMGNRQLAIRQRQVSRIAYCQLLIASLYVAKPFTVTGQVTSVTHPGLAESVLIDVGKLDLGRGPGRQALTAQSRGAGFMRRSFRGGACIQ